MVSGGCTTSPSPGGGFPITPAPVSAFKPVWQVGDSWQVRFSVQLTRRLKQSPASSQLVPQDVSYEYRVVAKTVQAGRNTATVSVLPLEPGWSQWNLTFDEDEVVLIAVEEVLPAGNNVNHKNPFGRDAWMAELDQYQLMIVHDFPNIPSNQVDETRTLSAPDSSTPAFTQTVTFSANEATVSMERTDPVTTEIHKTTALWESQEPWWSTIEIRLANQVRISGRLM